MSEFTLPSFAKINWYLRVLGKRSDGYHELCTIFQTVSLADKIHFSSAADLKLICNQSLIPTDEKNLIVKAANSLRERFEVGEGAAIYLEKTIPAPGGLGGGSSNAAMTLLGLVHLWKLKIDYSSLVEIAKNLGADVPFFLYGGTARGLGRGTEIELLDEIEENFLIIVTPPVKVSTAAAFQSLETAALTKESSKSILKICRQKTANFDLRLTDLKNDFERSVFSCAPEIERAKKTLLNLGASGAMMSGSGASVFGIFEKEETRQAALKALEVEKTWRRFAVATVSRRQFRDALGERGSLLPISF